MQGKDDSSLNDADWLAEQAGEALVAAGRASTEDRKTHRERAIRLVNRLLSLRRAGRAK